MTTLYLDCISGISGDMLLSSLIDLGADLTYITNELKKLPIDSFDMWVETVNKRGVSAKKLCLGFADDHVHEHYHEHREHEIHDHNHEHHHVYKVDHHSHHHRRAAEILNMIENSELPVRVKERSLAIFRAIAIAEGKIHGIDPEQVDFHEVGAMDSIIDIIGVCLALENFQIDQLYASPVPTGRGKVRMAHGLYPIPAPATAELLVGIPLAHLEVEGELTTPTGAGILKALVTDFISIGMGSMVIRKIGYGAGTKDFDHPNVLRAMLIEKKVKNTNLDTTDPNHEMIYMIETEIDDCTGEVLGYTIERLLTAGALDVYYTPVYMKKNRPGVLISVLSLKEKVEVCEEILLLETSTIGVRKSIWQRRKLDREIVTVQTSYGEVQVKQAIFHDQVVNWAPEYDGVASIARLHKVPFKEVYWEAMGQLQNK